MIQLLDQTNQLNHVQIKNLESYSLKWSWWFVKHTLQNCIAYPRMHCQLVLTCQTWILTLRFLCAEIFIVLTRWINGYSVITLRRSGNSPMSCTSCLLAFGLKWIYRNLILFTQIGIIGLVEQEWLVTLSALDADDIEYTDFVEAGKTLVDSLRNDEV